MTERNYFDLIYISFDVDSSISGFLSLGATALLVVLGFYYKIYQNMLGKMVLIVNTADFICILLKLFGFILKPTNDAYCRSVLSISQVAMIMSFIWGVFFAHTLYKSVEQQSVQSVQQIYKYYWIISSMVAIALGFGVLFTNYVFYNENLKTCVHRVYFRRFDPTMTFLTIIPTFVLCILCIIWYALGAKNMKKLIPDIRRRDLLPLLLYPAIVIICYFPCLITNTLIIFEILPSERISIVLRNIIHLHGFFNVLAYGLPTLKTALFKGSESKPREEMNQTYLLEASRDVLAIITANSDQLSETLDQSTIKNSMEKKPTFYFDRF